MKAENLLILKNNGINVPDFITVSDVDEIDLSFSSSEFFAVRSSFWAEDSEVNSFAGQFDTYLNVERENVADAFERVLKSYNNENAIKYAENKGVKLSENIKPIVIVEEMIDAELSGVMFTANPIGILNEITACVGFGLGDKIVEDKIYTTTYYYNKDDNLYYFEQNDNSPVLSKELLAELFETGLKIEKIFGNFMDIEFAVKDNIIYVLQARQISTLEYNNPIILDNSNIVESYPDITLPLTQSFVKEIYYKVFKSCVMRVTKNKRLTESLNQSLMNMTDTANGRVYYRISNWYCVLELLPFSKKIIKVWQDMLGVLNRQVDTNGKKISPLTKFTVACSFLYYLANTPRKMKQLNLYFEKQLPLYSLSVDNANSINELLKVYEEIKESLTSCWDITLINDMYAFLNTALAGKKNKDYISDIKNLESMSPVLSMKKLADTALKNGFDSEAYQTQKNEYIQKYGDRCLQELKLETLTYRTNPEILDAKISAMLSDGYEKINTENTIKQSYNIFVKKAKLGISNREISRMNRTRIFGLTRNIMLKIGAILTLQNRIECERDVFYLFYDEICENNIDFKQLIKQRKDEYFSYKELPAFSRLVFSERVINKHITRINGGIFQTSDCLHGTPASTGCVQGEILVIDEPRHDICTKDKIIVTKMTDPGWVFLIENSLGIISEKGSLLSHTAIIARELKKPSVVNVKAATALLKTGDKVRLDGDNGTITIIH